VSRRLRMGKGHAGSGAVITISAGGNSGTAGSPASTSNTFAALGIGTSDSTRKVFVFVGVRGSTAQASSVTVDGVSATFVDKADIGGAADGIEVWVAAVGTSSGHTTGDVVVNYASAPTRIGVSLYVVLNSTTTTSANSATGISAITAGPVTVPSGGALIAGVFGRGATAPTITWSGAFSSASDVSIQPGSSTGTLATGHSAAGAATGSQSETATFSVNLTAGGGMVVVAVGP
jgi:hypothetical protein